MSTRRPIVLMVEDEPSITEPLAEALDREGFDTRVAGTVARALERAGDEPPDLVLLDVMLPDGSGYDVCRELRRHSTPCRSSCSPHAGRRPTGSWVSSWGGRLRGEALQRP